MGPVTQRKLHQLGIRTIGDIADTDPEALAAMLGPAAAGHLHALANYHDPRPVETVPASRKLGREDAQALAREARTIVAAKGKKVATFDVSGEPSDEAVDAMLGPTGNLRAPTIRAGDTLLVGFDEEHYREVLLG